MSTTSGISIANAAPEEVGEAAVGICFPWQRPNKFGHPCIARILACSNQYKENRDLQRRLTVQPVRFVKLRMLRKENMFRRISGAGNTHQHLG